MNVKFLVEPRFCIHLIRATMWADQVHEKGKDEAFICIGFILYSGSRIIPECSQESNQN